jgi:peptidoglycan/LPS O-acetylase OafA/YrhL
MQRPAIPSLTGLRFCAAMAVVFAHATPKIVPYAGPPPLWHAALTQASGIGMPLFFVLSGFVMQYNYQESIVSRPATGLFRFYVARFSRIYPLYAVCVAADLLYSYGYRQLPQHTAETLPFYLTLTQTWFYAVFGDRSLIFQFGPVPQIAWSISTEWFFYLIFPIVCFALAKAASRFGRFAFAAGVILLSVLALWFVVAHHVRINEVAAHTYGPVADHKDPTQSFLQWLLNMSPYFQLPSFLVGCLTASLYVESCKRPLSSTERNFGGVTTILCVIAILAIFWTGYVIFSAASWNLIRLTNFPLVLPIAALLFCCARYDTMVSRALSSTAMLRGGEISYSIYLLHVIPILAFRWESAPVDGPVVLIADGLRLLFTVACIVGAAAISYEAVELPCKRLILKLASVRPLPVLAPAVESPPSL